MSKDNFEQILGSHCAPTFSGLKVASLISLPLASFGQWITWLKQYSPCFCRCGLNFMLLSIGSQNVLILIYRRKELLYTLNTPPVRRLLSEFGYPKGQKLDTMLAFLQERCRSGSDFPHEIGLFLGYPPEDVLGFITNHGHKFSYAGYWKVYANEEETRQFFAKMTACTNSFCAQLSKGAKVCDLIQ